MYSDAEASLYEFLLIVHFYFLFTLRGVCPVTTSEVSDFTVGGYIFEVGGKNKSQKQVHDVENAYVVKDDIEYGMRNVIPLWAFVFLY